MSHSHQGVHPVRPELADVVGTRPLGLGSTSAKRKFGPNKAEFMTAPHASQEARNEFNREMKDCWWGPMPVETFFGEFLPPCVLPLPVIPKSAFDGVPRNGEERAVYDKFVSSPVFFRH